MTKPADVPSAPLPGGVQLPLVGLGTCKLRGDEARTAVTAALAVGYRHIDTATMYGNEDAVGQALADDGVHRDDVFLTTKLRPSDTGQAEKILHRSLRALRTDRIDLWLLHWPPPRPAACRQAWNELIRLRDQGLIRAIGVSNFSLAQIDDLVRATGEAPAVNQVHWDPMRHSDAVLAGHRDRGVVVEGYSPLKDIRLDNPTLTEIARAHQVTAAQVILRWNIAHDIVVIPKSAHADRIAANIDLFGFEISDAEVAAIDALGRS
ncbi:MAG TPA: aldo/keto reductase [Streptosporangiaceae bacterium]|nr:aldo/keto reductase [Streptosporangiaceae bacterium]